MKKSVKLRLAAAAAVFNSLAFGYDWSGTDGKVVIPSGASWPITSAADVNKVAQLTEIEFADATAGAVYSDAANELALKAKLSGPGHFIANGAKKVVFSGDSRDFEGYIALTNTPAEMSSRYGLGSVKSRLILYQDTAGDNFVVSASGADCWIDVPILASKGFIFGPASASDTLVISNDLITAVGGYDNRNYFKNKVRMVAGRWGQPTVSQHLFPELSGSAEVWIEGDTKVDTVGNIYFMCGTSGIWHFGVKNENMIQCGELEPQISNGKFILESEDIKKGSTTAWMPYMAAAPNGHIDLNGHDQEAAYWGGQGTPTEADGKHYVVRSDAEATVTANGTSDVTRDMPAQFQGALNVHVKGYGTHLLKNSGSTSSGELRVSAATLKMMWNSKWEGTNIVVEGTGKLDCQCSTAITKGVATLIVTNNGVLNIAEGVTLTVARAVIGGHELESERTYTVAELENLGLGDFVTGSGSIKVEQYVPVWSGWPTEPGSVATIPYLTAVTVSNSEDIAKALACREIRVKGGSSVTFTNLPDGTIVTNTFSGTGTVKYDSAGKLYMDSDSREMVQPGHFEFNLCDEVIVMNSTALGCSASGDCIFTSDSLKRRNLLFAGEGSITNEAPILYNGALNFGPISAAARLYQANSWKMELGLSAESGYTYMTNKITFCTGTFGCKSGTVFFCGTKDSDFEFTKDVAMSSPGTTFFYKQGMWRVSATNNNYTSLKLGVSDKFYFICGAGNVFNTCTEFSLYNGSSSPLGYLDLNGYDQSAVYFMQQTTVNQSTTPYHAHVKSGAPAQLIATSTAGATRNFIAYEFLGQAGFWLSGNDKVTLSRTQSTSSGELRISGGSLTLNYAAAWGGTNIVVDGGTLIVDPTAGGKYDEASAAVPVFSRDAVLWVTGGGKLSIGDGQALKVKALLTGKRSFLAAGTYGSTAAYNAGLIDLAHVNDSLFDSACSGTITLLKSGIGFKGGLFSLR